MLTINKTFPLNCTDEEIEEKVKEARNSNPKKFLILILHWGEEYQLKILDSQQELAHKLIDAGADLIIGSHPHVVQEIEQYKSPRQKINSGGESNLIFYSLGNFIFDQYFSQETQEGLAVGLEIYPEKLIFRLFPIQSYLSQPFLMNQEEAKEFLKELALKSSLQLTEQIEKGIIEIDMNQEPIK